MSKAEGRDVRAAQSNGTLQMRTMRFVGNRGTALTHALNRFGVSRQVISIMAKRGQRKQALFGMYSVALSVPGQAAVLLVSH